MSIPWIDADRVEAATPWPELIDSIRDAFCNEGVSPARHSHRIPGEDREDITLLLMPSWTRAGDFGVKMISVAPSNASRRLPTINGVYVLFSADTGIPVALLDAETLTTRRTAAASALASERLARTDAKTLLVIGTGRVARQLIAAHCAVRPIEQVWVWGRSPDTAEQLAADVSRDSTVACAAVSRVESYAPRADIISTATFSEKPLLEGQWVNPGTHVDLVGAYKPTMCEADVELIGKADRIFVDTIEGAKSEAGDLIQAAEAGFFVFDEVAGDMYQLASRAEDFRNNGTEVTLFKSVGTALEDLAAARLCVRRRDGTLRDSN